jgi:ankyrin repeat protein
MRQYDEHRRTPLHYAAAARQHELLSLLLKHGADVTLKDAKGMTALHLSAMALDDAAMALLLSRVPATVCLLN